MVTLSSGGTGTIRVPGIPRITIRNTSSTGNVIRQSGLWVGNGAPGDIPGSELNESYLDLDTGVVYKLTPGG